jgi:hypothetical protein
MEDRSASMLELKALRLFSGEGISLAQTRERLPGVEEFDLEARGAVVPTAVPAGKSGAPAS